MAAAGREGLLCEGAGSLMHSCLKLLQNYIYIFSHCTFFFLRHFLSLNPFVFSLVSSFFHVLGVNLYLHHHLNTSAGSERSSTLSVTTNHGTFCSQTAAFFPQLSAVSRPQRKWLIRLAEQNHSETHSLLFTSGPTQNLPSEYCTTR